MLAPIVVVGHLLPIGSVLVPASEVIWRSVEQHAQVVIDMFFVLSGFVITAGYSRSFGRWPGWAAYGRYLWARLARFYPVHLAVLGLLVAVVIGADLAGFLVPHRASIGWDLVRHITLTNGWGGAAGLTWNGPSWSVSAEWFCYLLLPMVMPGVLRLRSPLSAATTYLLACAAACAVYAVVGFGSGTMTYVLPLPRAICGFVAGAALQQLVAIDAAAVRVLGRWTSTLAVLSIVVIVGLAEVGAPSLLALPLLGLVVLGLSQQRGWVSGLLAARPVVAAGEFSVALYLTHVPTLLAAALVITPQRFPGAWAWLGLGLAVLAVALVAWLARVAVERPAQRAMRRLVSQPHRAEPPTSTRPSVSTCHAPPPDSALQGTPKGG